MRSGLSGEGGLLLSLSLSVPLFLHLPSPSLSPSPCHLSLLTELQAVADVTDLEEEPLQRRAVHPGEPVVLALACSAEAQRLVQLVGCQLDGRRAKDDGGVVVAHGKLQNATTQRLCDAFATVARVHRHALQLDRVVVLTALCRHDSHHASVEHRHPETGAWQEQEAISWIKLVRTVCQKDQHLKA